MAYDTSASQENIVNLCMTDLLYVAFSKMRSTDAIKRDLLLAIGYE